MALVIAAVDRWNERSLAELGLELDMAEELMDLRDC